MTHEQAVHDRVNLVRLVCRLEKSVADQHWTSHPAFLELKTIQQQYDSYISWIKTQGTLQNLKYARHLLKNVQSNVEPMDATINYDSLRETLDRLEEITKEASEKVVPVTPKPPLMLPRMPQPTDTEETNTVPNTGEARDPTPESTLLPAENIEPPPESLSDLLLSPSDTSRTPAPSAITDASVRPSLHSSSAVHDELSAQLAEMATQLKRNALHFSESLVKDQAVLQGAQEKLETNYGFMQKERTRLRDHSGKSSRTTWLTVASVLIVIVSFVCMFFIIRLT